MDPEFSEKENERKAKRAKRSVWYENDEEAFLNCWEGYQWELRKCQRNSHIHAKMATDMGSKFSAVEIKNKIKNFTQRYRSEKKEVGPSGGSPSAWRFFNPVHKIIGSNAANMNPVDESFINDSIDIYETSESAEVSPPSIITSKSLAQPLRVPLPLSSTSSASLSDHASPVDVDSETPVKASGSKKRRKTENGGVAVLKKQGEEHLALFSQTIQDNKELGIEIVGLLRQQTETDAQIFNLMQKLVDKN